MPEMRFHIRWPDGQRESCYSPSLVVKEHLAVGDCYEPSNFLERCRAALTIASARPGALRRPLFACARPTRRDRAPEPRIPAQLRKSLCRSF